MYKIYTIRKDIKNLKYVKTIKMYKILTLIHLQKLQNCKIKKITFKNIQNRGLFVIFYLLFCTAMFVETFTGYTLTVKIVYDYVVTVVYINSFLNPVVYCWRIGEVRRAVKNRSRLRNRVRSVTSQKLKFLKL